MPEEEPYSNLMTVLRIARSPLYDDMLRLENRDFELAYEYGSLLINHLKILNTLVEYVKEGNERACTDNPDDIVNGHEMCSRGIMELLTDKIFLRNFPYTSRAIHSFMADPDAEGPGEVSCYDVGTIFGGTMDAQTMKEGIEYAIEQDFDLVTDA